MRHETSDMRYEASDMRHETSDMRYEASDMRYEASDMRYGNSLSCSVSNYHSGAVSVKVHTKATFTLQLHVT